MTLSPLKKLAIVLGTTIFLQGCVAAVIGGGAVAAKVGTDPRTTGTQIDDETLEFKVENAVEWPSAFSRTSSQQWGKRNRYGSCKRR